MEGELKQRVMRAGCLWHERNCAMAWRWSCPSVRGAGRTASLLLRDRLSHSSGLSSGPVAGEVVDDDLFRVLLEAIFDGGTVMHA